MTVSGVPDGESVSCKLAYEERMLPLLTWRGCGTVELLALRGTRVRSAAFVRSPWVQRGSGARAWPDRTWWKTYLERRIDRAALDGHVAQGPDPVRLVSIERAIAQPFVQYSRCSSSRWPFSVCCFRFAKKSHPERVHLSKLNRLIIPRRRRTCTVPVPCINPLCVPPRPNPSNHRA